MSGSDPRLYSGPPEKGRPYLKVWPHDLTVGRRFDTEGETGCVVTGVVEDNGNFLARDSDGVECQFNILMVLRVRPE